MTDSGGKSARGTSQFASTAVGDGVARPRGQAPVAAVASSWHKALTADPRALLFGGLALGMVAISVGYEYLCVTYPPP